MKNATDLELLQACVDGDRRAWSVFVERFSRYIYYIIRRTYERAGVKDADEEIADLHNEIFLAMLEDDRRRLRQYRGDNGCSVRSWVRIIAARKSLDALRKRKAHIPLDEAPVQSTAERGEDPLERLLDKEDQQRRGQLSQLVARLSERDQALLRMIYQERRSADDIAEALGIKKSALYTRKARLIKRLTALAEKMSDGGVRPGGGARLVAQKGGEDAVQTAPR